MLLLIDNYDSFTWNIFHYLSLGNINVKVLRNDQFKLNQIIKKGYDGIILSPGPGHPKTAGLMVELIKSNIATIPILGVCLGHQALGYSFGAKISKMHNVMHGRTDRIIKKKNISLFKNIPKQFIATRYHSLEVDKKNLPDCIEIIATTKDGCIMGIKIKNRNLFGLQFHPESIATDYGKLIFQNFINICKGKD